MLNVDPSPERAQLGFREAVLSCFRFLQFYGMHSVDEKVTFVRYESDIASVNVYHGRASYELGIEVGRLAEPNDKVTLYEIISWAGAEEAEGLANHAIFQVSSSEGVQRFVPKLAELVQKYAAPFLRGEQMAYESLKELRSQWTADYTKEVRLRDVRKRVEPAWNAKDYARVAELLRSMREYLTRVEAKRLDYAEKHNQASGSRGRDSGTKMHSK